METRVVEDHVQLANATGNVPLLARLVNYQPLFSTQPKLKSYPLSELSSPEQRGIQEALVVRDLLNVLVGLEGVYIRYNNSYDPHSGAVPDFKIAKMMDPSFKSFSKRIARLGKYYVVLTKTAEKWSEPSFGSILHRLGFEIKQFLRFTYLSFISGRLERDFRESTTFSISELEQSLNDAEITKQMEILFTMVERIDREDRARRHMDHVKEDFDNFINDLKDQSDRGYILATDTRMLPIAKGAVILRIIQTMVHENLGDRYSVSFLQKILNSVAGNYCDMLFLWLTEGRLNDPYDEFMVVDTMNSVNDVTSYLQYGDRLWDTQYVIRKDGILEQFEPNDDNELLFMVLTTGKLVNLIKTSLGKVDFTLATSATDEITNFSDLMEGSNLELYVDKWYKEANRLCLKMYFEGYDLMAFFKMLEKHYLGYHNIAGITKFLQKNMVELTRRFKKNGYDQEKLQRTFQNELKSNLSSNEDLVKQLLNLQLDDQSFEEVIMEYVGQDYSTNGGRTMSNQDDGDRLLSANNFQNLKDILLQELKPLSSGADGLKAAKSTIYHLNFEIIVPFPLSIIVTRTCIVQYQIISRYSFLLQYNSKLLDDTWIEINKNASWRYTGFSKQVRLLIIRKSRVVHNRMNQFIKLILEYFTQVVVEREIKITSKTSQKRATITDWQLSLQESLTNIMTNCCLSQLIEIQLQIFEIIHKFCKFITSMRREFCQLDPHLFQLYLESHSRRQNKPSRLYSSEESTKIISEYTRFVDLAANGFNQHIAAFKEGLMHHYSANGSKDTSSDDNHNTARLLACLPG
ncbi:hypothetical protein HG536_0A00850 [Torulaspora globosa]|uniref:Spindle pole body component n=1 Tax=Torulaspora globosa TaxID=48254 RepID=A0A7G3Z9T2_9SACH|nr:uncharacterized protein HG536_0A00850 [Torulaspora globosa]QLL30268.1 hypothetical protein HG536_0A00850 [Torulaspora globosa]